MNMMQGEKDPHQIEDATSVLAKNILLLSVKTRRIRKTGRWHSRRIKVMHIIIVLAPNGPTDFNLRPILDKKKKLLKQVLLISTIT